MREILFKAKLKNWRTNPQHNKWVEGFYLSRRETTYCFKEDYEKFPVKTLHYIADECMTDWGLPNEFRYHEIDPDTLCQYTGLTDKNGRKIWENDIVDRHGCGCGFATPMVRVRFDKGGFEPFAIAGWECTPESSDVEVIGNVFDDSTENDVTIK